MSEDEKYFYFLDENELKNLRSVVKPLPKGIKNSMKEIDGKQYIDVEKLCEFFRIGAMYPESYIKYMKENESVTTKMIFKGAAFWAMTLHFAFDKLLSEIEFERTFKVRKTQQ